MSPNVQNTRRRRHQCLRVSGLGVLALLTLLLQTPSVAAAEHKSSTPPKDATHVVSTSSAYIGIDPIYTTIFTGDRISGSLMLGIGLDVEDKTLRDKVAQMQPVLRDLYVRTMLAYAAVSVRPWRKPDPVAIANRLQLVTDRKLKAKGAKILLAQLAIRLTN